MASSPSQLRADAERIWRAGVEAVLPERLVPRAVRVAGDRLSLVNETIWLDDVRRVAIVGAGKASAGMAVALENVLGDHIFNEKDVVGWVNVPADCIVPTRRIHLHAARPEGVNEPRPEGVEGTQEILRLVGELNSDDLCICLFSGGGSALLPCPVPGITLEDKIQLTRAMSAAGANIEQMNMVRRPLSLVKGGGLARHCRAGRLVSLILSDVPGDPPETIASGPTVESSTTAADALAVLSELGLKDEPSLKSVGEYLQSGTSDRRVGRQNTTCSVSNLILGNYSTAVEAAGREAERLGYSPQLESARQVEGSAEAVGERLAEATNHLRSIAGANALISGGEPTVALIDEKQRGKGGRNQQLVLTALAHLGDCRNIAFLSGGTDGEDGPTDAAGAVVDQAIAERVKESGLSIANYLSRNDAYHFFERVGGLFKTGPTHTNVGDLRVAVVKND